MRGLAPLLLGILLAWPGFSAAQGEERLWYVDVDLMGPLQGVTLDCGAAGSTRLGATLVGGERSTLRVPVPARVPLGPGSLERIPLPTVESAKVDGRVPGQVQVLGWSEEQPAAAMALLPPGLKARATPAVALVQRHASAGGLLGLTLAFALGVLLRRRRWLGLLAGGGMAIALVGVAAREGARRNQTVVVEADLTRDIWLEVRAARHELVGAIESLRVEPEGGRVELELEVGAGAGGAQGGRSVIRARAKGKVLVGRRRLVGARRDLGARLNRLGDFRAAFVRDPAGRWTPRGAWKVGEALPGVGEGDGEGAGAGAAWAGPPGWLATGLPPGEWALLGRLEDGRWVRAMGFRGERR